MAQSPGDMYLSKIDQLDPTRPQYIIELVDLIIAEARALDASDIHLLPTDRGLEVRYRIDGVLQPSGVLPADVAPNVVARLKILADLVTYRSDIPQEGHIRRADDAVEMRITLSPTFFGEKVVIRLFGGGGRYDRLGNLGFADEVRRTIGDLLAESSGVLLFAGPAGSGKTTTLYACLRELLAASGGGRSVSTIEDPVEVVVPGVAQSQINPAAGYDLTAGLRSLLRQDPEVIALGEIRDVTMTELALQAALTGHLVCSTFHAGRAAEVIGRLSGMGIEPYVIRNSLRAIVCQRLLRRLCTCARPVIDAPSFLGLPVRAGKVAVGCPNCRGTGYKGRLLLAELLQPDHPDIGPLIGADVSVAQLTAIARQAGMVTLWERALAAVESGMTSPAEVRRVFGLSEHRPSSSDGAPVTHEYGNGDRVEEPPPVPSAGAF